MHFAKVVGLGNDEYASSAMRPSRSMGDFCEGEPVNNAIHLSHHRSVCSDQAHPAGRL